MYHGSTYTCTNILKNEKRLEILEYSEYHTTYTHVYECGVGGGSGGGGGSIAIVEGW